MTDLTIAADADEAGEAAAQKAAQRFLGEIARVLIARPTPGHNDFNDMLISNVVAFRLPGKAVTNG